MNNPRSFEVHSAHLIVFKGAQSKKIKIKCYNLTGISVVVGEVLLPNWCETDMAPVWEYLFYRVHVLDCFIVFFFFYLSKKKKKSLIVLLLLMNCYVIDVDVFHHL
jgi:hypothetical protein